MDIFEYIDRVKANFDKKPEPRYNMKKYFMGGSVTTPKRGLVDEPGSYSITAKEQKNVDAWNKRLKSAIEAGVVKPYEEQPRAVRYKIRQGQNAGLPTKPFGKFTNPIKTQFGTVYSDVDNVLTNLTKKSQANVKAWEKATGKKYADQDKVTRKGIALKGTDYTPLSEISAKKKLRDKALEIKRTEQAKNLKTRNDKILKIINNNPDLNAGQIAKRAGVNDIVVTRLTKNLGIDLMTKYDQLLPELKALDKLIKKNSKFLSGDASIADKRRFLFAEMQKQFGPNYTPDEFIRRIQTLGNRYVGQLDQIDAYKDFKGPNNYKGSALHKNIVGMAKGSYLGVSAEARLLGLPKKQIQLLDDVLGGASKLTKMKVAGDHTDINALMKDFPNYKKNFTRINIISNRLNTEKLGADNQLIKLVRQLNNKEITPQEFRTQVEEVRTNFMNKTKVKIGNPVTDARGNVSLDFQTDRIIDLKNPRNKVIAQAVTNLIEQEGVKFSDFDIQYSQANTVKDRLNLLKDASVEALQKSKVMKSFAEMSGNVGKAAKNILKSKVGKYGVVPAGMYAALTTIASAEQPDDVVEMEKPKTDVEPLKYLPDYGDAALAGAAAAGVSKYTKKDPLKQVRRFPKKALSNIIRGATALEAPSLAIPQSAYEIGNLIGDVKRGEKTDASAFNITFPTSLAYAAAGKKYGLDLFAANAGKIKKALRSVVPFNPTLQNIARLSKGSVFATPIIETAIQMYNAKKRLEDAKKKSSVFEPTVDTLLGKAPESYYNEIMSEIPSKGGLNEFSIPFTDKKFTLPEVGVGEFQASSGGIASGPPPEKGPQSQGLAYLMKNGKR